MRAAFLLLLAALAAPAAARDVPPLAGRAVVDEAGMLDPRSRRELEALCQAAWNQPADHRVQLQFLLVASLQGDALEDFSNRAYQAYRLGEKGRDNGVLVLVARDERRVRIETGYGAEGALTDAQAGRIIRNDIAPAFREGRPGEGLRAAAVQILSALGALPEGTARAPRQPGGGLGIGLGALIALLVTLAVVGRLFSAFSGRGGGWGGGWGGGLGGGSGFGGGGGGGWSGGGGSSGGGGASGSW